MIKIFVILLFVCFTHSYATNSTVGITYFKQVKAKCNLSALSFAHKHTQNEWENIKQAGQFNHVAKKICPQVTLKPTQENKAYAFVYEYAKDSGKIPSF